MLWLSRHTVSGETSQGLLLNPRAPGLGEAASSKACLSVCTLVSSLLYPSSGSQSWKMAQQPNELCNRKDNSWYHLLESTAVAESEWKDSLVVWVQRKCLEEQVSHVFPKRQNMSIMQVLKACLLTTLTPCKLLPCPHVFSSGQRTPLHTLLPVTLGLERGLI